jgi:hypothetical protein
MTERMERQGEDGVLVRVLEVGDGLGGIGGE